MKLIQSPSKLNRLVHQLKRKGRRIGFVPTMGYLHKGHLALVKRALKENDVVIVSIFVNPTQFGPKEDFKRYPRNLKRDQKFLKQVHTDYLFAPTRRSVYPKGFREFVSPGPLAKYLCGPKRPGHFQGVATVVNRLFQMVAPDSAYFGEKDYQQLRVIQEMVRRFRLPIAIKRCPIVRERDGLAMSSRNRYLSTKERIQARALYQSLLKAHKLIKGGERDAGRIKREIRKFLKPYVTKIDYVEISNPSTLVLVKRVKGSVLVTLACFIGTTRLIDNKIIKV